MKIRKHPSPDRLTSAVTSTVTSQKRCASPCWYIALLCAASLLWAVVPARAADSQVIAKKLKTAGRSDAILLRSRVFVPKDVQLQDESSAASVVRPTPWHGIIQFEPGSTDEQLAVVNRLAKDGVKTLNFIPISAVSALIPANYDASLVPGVRWVGDFKVTDKLLGDLTGANFLVGFHPDCTTADVDRLLKTLGATKLEPGYSHPDNIVLVSMPIVSTVAATTIAALDEVAWVKQAPEALLKWAGDFVYFCPGTMTPFGYSSEIATTKASIAYAYRTSTRGKPISRYVLYSGSSGWDGPGLGSATDLRYYFGTPTSQLPIPDQHSYIASALNTWAKYVQIAFTETSAANQYRSFDFSFYPHNHDIDGSGPDTSQAAGKSAHSFPPGAYPETIAGDTHFDSEYVGTPPDGGWARSGVLYTFALHEQGHSLGLDHSEQSGTVMSSTITQIYTDLTQDDINGIRAVYATPVAIPAATISGFSPTEGYPPYDTLGQAGTTVTVTGTNLSNPSQATFNGLIAPIVSSSPNSVTLVVPKGASTGRITINGAGGNQAVSSTNFKVNFANNDPFSGRQRLKGPSGFVAGNTSNATEEGGEPYHAGIAGAHSVWFNWKAPAGISEATFKTRANSGSGFDTTLAIYQGSAVNGLTPVASNNDSNGTAYSSVTFAVTTGAGYKIAVDGNGASSGGVVLKWNTSASSGGSSGEIADGYVPPPYYPDPYYPPGSVEP